MNVRFLPLLLPFATAALLAAPAPNPDYLSAFADSPRHHEWLHLTTPSGPVDAFVAFPERKSATAAVIVIHENRGLDPWARTVADRLAEAGYLAIAPDMLTGKAPGGGRTDDFPSPDAAREAIYQLSPEFVTAALDACFAWAAANPACNGRVSVAGFCWGGSQSFAYATANPKLAFACVFYGSSPTAGLDRISSPVYGFYAENDARINEGVPPAQEALKALGKAFDPVFYPGAGHAFMRRADTGAAPNDPNFRAAAAAWQRWLQILALQP